MLEAITDLTRTRPHMRTSARFTPPEIRAYHEGYYTALTMAIKVAELGAERFKLRMKTLAAETRRKRSA